MAVQGNEGDNISTATTSVVHTVIPSTHNTNSIIQAFFSPGTSSTDVKPQLFRVVQASPNHVIADSQVQPQLVKVVTQNGEKITAANANVVDVRTPTPSPIKAGQTTFISIPTGARVVPAKLKVGDTITIPKSTFIPENISSNDTTGQTMLPSTPAKLIQRAEDPSSDKQSVSFNNATIISPVQVTTGVQRNASPSLQLGHVTAFASPLSQSSPYKSHSVSMDAAQRAESSPYKRHSVFMDAAQRAESKRRKFPASKGLRHFAMLVCEKVKQKKSTTYNEVADELVSEFVSEQQYDQKNIRRRVYDALNVLMAMDIIYKDKKDIFWVGLPTNSAQEIQRLELEKKKREESVQQKTRQLEELILQQIAFQNLIKRNKRLQQTQGLPSEKTAIQLPFILVNTSKETVIDCSISNDKYEYLFNFDDTFEIHDDIEVLKRMGMACGLEAGKCSKENLKVIQSLLPPVLKPYLEQMAGCSVEPSSSSNSSSLSDQKCSQLNDEKGNDDERSDASSRHNTNNIKEELVDVEPYYSLGHLDEEDREVAMVTNGSDSNDFAPSTRSSSSGLQSVAFSLTPASSSAETGSRGSTPFDALDV